MANYGKNSYKPYYLRGYSKRRRRSAAPRVIIGIALFLAVAVGVFFLASLIINARPEEAKLLETYLNGHKYQQAKDYRDSVLVKLDAKKRESMDKDLTKEITKHAQKYIAWAKSAQFSEAAFNTSYKGFDIFYSTISNDLKKSVDNIYLDFRSGKIAFDEAMRAVTNICSFDQSKAMGQQVSGKIQTFKSSQDNFIAAQQAYAAGDLPKAIDLYKKVSPEDAKNYASAVAELDRITSEYISSELERLERLYNGKDYINAYKGMDALHKLFPNNETISALWTQYRTAYLSTSYVEYQGPIEHVFTHCLIAFPELGFGAGGTYDADCISVYEFKKIIQSMYEKGYILVRPSDVWETYNATNGQVKLRPKKLMLPKGKMPVIFSIDDMVYDSSKMGRGMVDKLILQNGKVVTYTKMADGTELISDDNECIPILDKFVAEHPDFSYNGAKLTLALTGFEGILGYRTYAGAANRESEITECKKVLKALKDSGYEIASHSYKHGHMKTMSDGSWADDITKWDNEVESLLGEETRTYVFPYGEWSSYQSLDARMQMLFDDGFRIFCGVGSNQFTYENYAAGYVFMDRRPFDGQSLRRRSDTYAPFFNCRDVYDPARRVPFE